MASPGFLDELQRVRLWHVAHKRQRPVECMLFDAVLALWLVGCVGWLPALILGQVWLLPMCLLAIATPQLYLRWRARAHVTRRLRCDWLAPST